MNLGNPADPNLALWGWEKKKLGCRIRPETGNPAVDEIRDRLSRMTGVDVPELESVAGGRTSGRPQTGNLGKTLRTGTVRSFETSRSNTSAFGDTAGSTLRASPEREQRYYFGWGGGERKKAKGKKRSARP